MGQNYNHLNNTRLFILCSFIGSLKRLYIIIFSGIKKRCSVFITLGALVNLISLHPIRWKFFDENLALPSINNAKKYQPRVSI